MIDINNVLSTNYEINKSKFIAFLFACDDIEQFKKDLEYIRKMHKKASHVVYAYHINDAYKSNDDGEPHGTAGRPILELLIKKEINNHALVVVRYFGGSKLGASRLLRSYLKVAVDVIELSEVQSCKNI